MLFVECMLGNYGKNCIYKCNTQCIVSNQCNRFTGHCNGGCKQGWAGNMCDQGKFILSKSMFFYMYNVKE